MTLPQSLHLCDQRASFLRTAILHFREQYFGVLSDTFLLKNTFPQNSQVNVQHFLQYIWCPDAGFSIITPHLAQAREGQVGKGTRLVSKNKGCSDQYLLSALEWHFLQRVIRLLFALASRVCWKSLNGTLWWQSNVLEVPFIPQRWQVELSRLRTSALICFQCLPYQVIYQL